MIKDSKLTKLELYSENDEYYLRAEYEVIYTHRKTKITIPKIKLPLFNNPLIATADVPLGLMYTKPMHEVNIGFGKLEMCNDQKDRFMYEEVLKEYPQKMTVDEIEKELGYKVEIVSKKE